MPVWTSLGLWLLLHLAVAIVLHEAGHVAGGWLSGLRVRAVGAGSTRRAWQVRLGGVVLFLGRQPWRSATTWTEPEAMVPTQRQLLLMLAGGPTANLACAALLAFSPAPGPRLGAMVHLALALANLWPWDVMGPGPPTDGARWVAVRRGLESLLVERSTSSAAAAGAVGLARLGCAGLAARLWALAAELLLDEEDPVGAAQAARRARHAVTRAHDVTRGAVLCALAAMADVEVESAQPLAREACLVLARAARGDRHARARAALALARWESTRRPHHAARLATVAARAWTHLGARASVATALCVQAEALASVDRASAARALRDALSRPATATTALRLAALCARLDLAETGPAWARARRHLRGRMRVLRPSRRARMAEALEERLDLLSGGKLEPARVHRDLTRAATEHLRTSRALLWPAVVGGLAGAGSVPLALAGQVAPWVAALACGAASGLAIAFLLARQALRRPWA
jgi:hypothetical protein